MRKKYLTRFLTVVCTVVMVLSISVTSFAQTPMTPSEQAVTSSATFDVLLKPSEQGTITPYSTWDGPGGFSRLDYMSSYGGFYWCIDVTRTSYAPLTFKGKVSIYTESTGKYVGSTSVGGDGPGKASGITYGLLDNYTLNHGTRYLAYFSGTAINSEGQSFYVVDDAHIGFLY